MAKDGIGTIEEEFLPDYLKTQEGTYEKDHDNYGNYIDNLGSIYVCFPKTKKYKNVFLNAKKEVNAVFVAKYPGANENGVFVSKRDLDPATTDSDTNPVTNIYGCIDNRFADMIDAPKSIGSDFFLTTVKIYSMLSAISKKHKKRKINSHNGKKNGVFFKKNFWEVALGYTHDGKSIKKLKKKIDLTTLSSKSAYDFSNYKDTNLEKLTSLKIYGSSFMGKYLTCLVGGFWYYSSLAGGFSLALDYARSNSSNNVGGRASVFL